MTFYAEANNLLNQPLRYYQGTKDRTMQAEYYLSLIHIYLLGQDQTFTAKLQLNAANCDYVDYALGNNVFYKARNSA